MTAIHARVADVLARAGVTADARLLLGLSGGLDSTVLLQVLAELRGRFGFDLRAHHVHHGLSPHADAWAAHCVARCEALGVPCTVSRVRVSPAAGEGWEAAARQARHAAWAATPADWWVTAHHRGDQAETVLFRLLRGAGVHGAAAMGEIVPANGGPGRLRPLLALPRATLAAAAQGAQLPWVEDESNADRRFARNFIRHALLPRMRSRFPAAEATLARAAERFAEAAALVDELAAIDAAACGERPLSRAAFADLSGARQANLVRWQLRRLGRAMPDRARLHEALRQLATCSVDHPLCVPLGDGVLHAYRDALWLTPPLPSLPAAPVNWRPDAPLIWGEGHLVVEPVIGAGIARDRVQGETLQVRTRWPGCRIALPDRPSKPVNKLAQEIGMSPADRDRVPIVCLRGEPVWMAGVGATAAFACPPGGPGLLLRWRRPAAYSASGETDL